MVGGPQYNYRSDDRMYLTGGTNTETIEDNVSMGFENNTDWYIDNLLNPGVPQLIFGSNG